MVDEFTIDWEIYRNIKEEKRAERARILKEKIKKHKGSVNNGNYNGTN